MSVSNLSPRTPFRTATIICAKEQVLVIVSKHGKKNRPYAYQGLIDVLAGERKQLVKNRHKTVSIFCGLAWEDQFDGWGFKTRVKFVLGLPKKSHKSLAVYKVVC